jgi:chromosome segregation ATPase
LLDTKKGLVYHLSQRCSELESKLNNIKKEKETLMNNYKELIQVVRKQNKEINDLKVRINRLQSVPAWESEDQEVPEFETTEELEEFFEKLVEKNQDFIIENAVHLIASFK